MKRHHNGRRAIIAILIATSNLKNALPEHLPELVSSVTGIALIMHTGFELINQTQVLIYFPQEQRPAIQENFCPRITN